VTFQRIKPYGWQVNEKITSPQITQLDINVSNALDKTGDNMSTGGGVTGTIAWLSGSEIVFDVGSEFHENGSMNIESGGSLFIQGGATLDVKASSTFTVYSTLELEGGALLQFDSGAQGLIESGGQLNIAGGGSIFGEASSTIESAGRVWLISGSATTLYAGASAEFQSGSTTNFDAGSVLNFAGTSVYSNGAVLQLGTSAASNSAVINLDGGSSINVASSVYGASSINFTGSAYALFSNISALGIGDGTNTATLFVNPSSNATFQAGSQVVINNTTASNFQVSNFPKFTTAVSGYQIQQLSIRDGFAATSESGWSIYDVDGNVVGINEQIADGGSLWMNILQTHNGATLNSINVNYEVGVSHTASSGGNRVNIALYTLDNEGNLDQVGSNVFATTTSYTAGTNYVVSILPNIVINNQEYEYILYIRDEVTSSQSMNNNFQMITSDYTIYSTQWA
jgi:hypothetical protein